VTALGYRGEAEQLALRIARKRKQRQRENVAIAVLILSVAGIVLIQWLG
jgi:hypothetical protein